MFVQISSEMAFPIGKLFSKYEDIEEEIKKFESENFVKLYKKDSCTIKAARKRCPNKNFSADIKYSELAFECIHNGKYKPNTKTGERPNQKTFRSGCGFVVKFRASADGQHLMVTAFVDSHNHEVSAQEYNMNPSVRRLDSETKEEIKGIIKMNGNCKLIQQYYAEKTGKSVFMRDIHNLATQTARQSCSDVTASDVPASEVQALADWLKSEHPTVDHHFLLDENEVVQGLYIQDAMMKDKFQKFPEVILVDSTHKTNLNAMPLFVILCIDGNGDSHVVAAFLVHHEDEVTVREMVKVFKAKNPASGETSVIITDKDMTERGIFKTELPDIELQICFFHVLRTFGREVIIDKLGITSGERQTILAKLQELTYART